MALLIVAGIIFLFIAYVLVAPIWISVDTDKSIFVVYQPGLFSVRYAREKKFPVEIRVAGFRIRTDRKRDENRKRHAVPAKDGKKRRRSRSFGAWKFLIRRVVDAFRVRRFVMDIDTDNFMLNSQMIPLLYFSNLYPDFVNVNFMGRNFLAMTASVRPISLLWAYLLFLTKK
jgi:hypothetical protein